MDGWQFDNLTRVLASDASRRTGLRLLAGAALLALARGSGAGVMARHGTHGPGDPCRDDSQCAGADAPMVCAWNGFGHDGSLNCCTYEGNRCGSDDACCGLAACVGGFCSSGGFSSAGSGGFATANAQGGTVSIGDINSGGNIGNVIDVGNTRGNVQVAGGTVSNVTDVSVSAEGGMAIADASGGSGNVSGDGSAAPYYVGPGDTCQYSSQCLAADTALTCDYVGNTDDYRCCTYEGGRCGWDGSCCGWLRCTDDGFCTSAPPSNCSYWGCACNGGVQGACDDWLVCCTQGGPGAWGTCQRWEDC